MFHLKKIQLPHKVLVGNNILKSINTILFQKNICKNIAIICGGKTISIVEEKLIPWTKNSKINYKIFLCKEGSKEEVDLLKEKINQKYNIIIGMGGGKNIDVAKVIASELNIDFISIPTAPSHDGIASSFASIKKNRMKYSIRTKPPVAILCDIKIIQKADKRFFSSGFCDAYSNFIATCDWNLAKKEVLHSSRSRT